MNEEDLPSFSALSLVGAAAVVIVYWIHLALINRPLIDETGVSLTIFISAYLAQYLPLRALKTRLLTKM